MRKITREKVMELLYLLDIHRQVAGKEHLSTFLLNDADSEKMIQLSNTQKKFLLNNKDDISYFEATFNGVVEHMVTIDETIQKYMKSTWSIEQIGFVERAILRLAVYELNWSQQEGLMTEVIIASALELAEKYTDESSGKFIHGILGAMMQHTPPQVATAKERIVYQKRDEKRTKENLAKYKKSKLTARKK